MSRGLVGPADDAHYVKATLGALPATRIEMRLRALDPNSVGAHRTVFFGPAGSLRIDPTLTSITFTPFKAGEAGSITIITQDPVFTSFGGHGLPRYVEVLVRWQFDPALLRYTLELWNLTGTDRLAGVMTNGVAGNVVTAANLDAGDWGFGNDGFGAGRIAGSMDWVRLYNTVVPYNSAAPVMAAPVAAAVHHAWELENSLADTATAGPVALTWVGGGSPTYEDSVEAPTVPPVLSSATYNTGPDRVSLVFTDPNALGANESAVDVERRIGTGGDWLRMGFTTAADLLAYEDTQIAHATTYNYRVKARNRLGSTAYSNIVAVTTGAGTDTNPTVTENAKTGTAAWTLTNPATAREIEGYADQFSVNRGGTINLKVNSLAGENFNLDVFRLGWYGGLGARRVRNILAVAGTAQTIPSELGAAPLRTRECAWTTSYALALTDADPTEWPSGIYLARLTQVSAGKQAYIVFCVRDDTRRSALYYNQPVFTYHAYNAWPSVVGTPAGRSLYGFNSVGGTAGDATAEVAFNRPYAIAPRADAAYGLGAGDLIAPMSVPNVPYGTRAVRSAGWEINWIRYLEKQGYDVQYGTDMDLHTRQADIWARAASLLFPGHPEYVTLEMRDTVLAARDYGRHLAFLGANSFYWQVRLAAGPASAAANRALICYKTLVANDPINATQPRNDTALQWRQLGDHPVPEESFVGTQYEGDPAGDASFIITSAGAAHRLLTGTTLTAGSTVPGMIGYEWDHSGPAAPAAVVKLSHNVFTPGTGYSGPLPITGGDATIYDTARGAHVFSTGSMQTIWAADDYGVAEGGRPSYLSAPATRLLKNVLDEQSIASVAEAAGGPATKLIIVQQPVGAASGSEMPTPPIVAVADAGGTIIPGAGVRISCAIHSGVGLLTGPDFKDTLSDGKSDFTGQAFWGSAPLTLRFTAPGLTSVDSAAFTPTAQTGTFDGIYELPRVEPNPPLPTVFAATTTVATTAALQTAIDTYAAILDGQAREIRLADGVAFDNVALGDSVKIRTHTGVNAGPILIRNTTLPVSFPRRVQAADFDGLSSCMTMTGRGYFATEHNADNYFFLGLHVFQGHDGNDNTAVIELGDDGSEGQINSTFCPKGITFERCWLHGDPAGLCQRAVAANAQNMCFRYCRISDCHVNGGYGDANALQMWSTPGGLYVFDSYLEGGDECVIIGGGSPIDDSLIPGDVTLRKCHLARPVAWKGVWNVKNIIDWKNCRRTLIEGCVFENNWLDGQDGQAFVIKSTDQDSTRPHSGTRDFTLRNCALRNTGGGLTIAGKPSADEACRTSRTQIYNLVTWNVDTPTYPGTGRFILHSGDGFDWATHHLTFVGGPDDQSGFALLGSGVDGLGGHGYVNRWDVRDIIFARIAGFNYGAHYDQLDPDGRDAFALMSPLGVMQKNVFAGLSGNPFDYTPENYVAADDAAVGFVDLAGAKLLFELGDPSAVLPLLKLAGSSPYKGVGTAGTDPGADIDAVVAAIAGAWVAGECGGTGTATDPLVGVPAQLLVQVAPGGAVSGQALTQQPVFIVADVYGNVCPTSTLTATVTPVTPGTSVTGGVKRAVAGVIAFTGLTLTGPGVDTFLVTLS